MARWSKLRLGRRKSLGRLLKRNQTSQSSASSCWPRNKPESGSGQNAASIESWLGRKVAASGDAGSAGPSAPFRGRKHFLGITPGRQRPLPFWRKLPPRLGGFPCHEADCGDENVDHAGIVTDYPPGGRKSSQTACANQAVLCNSISQCRQ